MALRIGQLPVDPPLFLAPMAGVTDRDFRGIVRRIGGVGVVAMEFISSRNLIHGQPTQRRQTLEMMRFDEAERPLAIQIYGSDVPTMAEAARAQRRQEKFGGALRGARGAASGKRSDQHRKSSAFRRPEHSHVCGSTESVRKTRCRIATRSGLA
jgi:hypothetical protein